MNLSRFATHHAKPILFVTIVLSIVGIWILRSFPVGIIPDMTFPRLVVIVETANRPAEMMVVDVVRPLEQAIATVPGVTRVRSKTQRGATEISVDFAWGTDMITALQLVNSKVSEARPQLPPETDISVERMNPTVFPVLGLSLRAEGLSQSELWSLATYTLCPRLSRVPGVAQVVVQGGRVPEIAVDVDPRRLAAHQLSLDDVEQALTKTNILRATGLMNRRFNQYQVLVSGQMTDPSQLGSVVVAQRGGVPLYLRQVASIHRSVEDRTTIVTADGAESVLINIVRQPNANTVSVVDGVRREIANAKSALPPGMRITSFYDQSTLIHQAVASVRDAVLIGLILAIVVLMLFLGNLRSTLVTVVTIPATLMITFMLLRLSGLTLNIMTLGALAVAIGLVIDDAIVVVENIFRHLSHGETTHTVVRNATSEILMPMISSTLTTVVVFLPLVLLTGVAGAFFAALAITVVITLTVSLFLALLVIPGIAGTFLRTRPGAADHGRVFERVISFYERVLRLGIQHRWAMLGIAVAIIASTGLIATQLGTGFMPTMDEGAFILDYWTPPGTSLLESDRMLSKIDKILQKTPEVTSYSRRTGTELGFAITEPNTGDYAVTLNPGRHRSIETIMDSLRQKIEMEAPGAQIEFVEVLQDLIGDMAGAPAPVEVKLFGQQQEQLAELAPIVAAKLSEIPGAVDVNTSLVESGPALIARIDPSKAGRVGMTADEVATQVNAAMFGDVPTQIVEHDQQVAVRVRYPAGYRNSLANLTNMLIRTPAGFYLPMTMLGRIEKVAGTTEINREDQRRLVTITARLSERDLGSVMRDVQTTMRKISLPPGVTYTFGGQFKSQDESFRMLLVVLILAVLLVFTVMLFQFGSFTIPGVILLVMPLSFFGVTLALWITGTPLNVSSFMGAIMLIGITGENSILLFHQVHTAEKDGVAFEEAVVHAGGVRLRPILMTALAAILALLPLALGLGAGAEMQKPLAIAVIGGLSFSTIFTLVFGPVLYISLREALSRRSAGD